MALIDTEVTPPSIADTYEERVQDAIVNKDAYLADKVARSICALWRKISIGEDVKVHVTQALTYYTEIKASGKEADFDNIHFRALAGSFKSKWEEIAVEPWEDSWLAEFIQERHKPTMNLPKWRPSISSTSTAAIKHESHL